MAVCIVSGCDARTVGRGWCSKHYFRWRKYGDVTVVHGPPVGRVTEKPEVRFLRLITRGTSSCWLWKCTRTAKGYGMFSPGVGGPKMQSAHRWSYEHFVGVIPDGLQLDHLCRVRHCVNPAHLEPVTSKVNQERSPFAPNKRTHCPQGHPYEGSNLYLYPDGRRACRTCASLARAAYEARKGMCG